MTTASPRPRFVGSDVFLHPAGGVIVSPPSGRLTRLQLEAPELGELMALCDGRRSVSEIAAAYPNSEDVGSLLEHLLDIGALEATTPKKRVELVVVGDGALASTLDELLRGNVGSQFAAVLGPLGAEGLGTAASPPGRCVVAVSDHFDIDLFRKACVQCARQEMRFSPVYLAQERAWFGPHMDPGGRPDVEDLHERLLAAARDPGAFQALSRPATDFRRSPLPATNIVWALSQFLVDFQHWCHGEACQGIWHQVELDFRSLSVTRHPVLPSWHRPWSSVSAPTSVRGARESALVDKRTGIIVSISEVQHSPPFDTELHMARSRMCDMRRVGEFRNDPVGGGGSFRSFEDASHAAIGEGVERYCGNLIQTDRLRVASFETLAGEGSCAVDPETLVMFSDAQYSAPGFPFAPLERHRPVVWIDGYNMTTAERAWLPASLVYANWHPPNGASGAPVNGTFFPGIAAGTSFDNAVAAGLLEVIERHVTMVWWMNRLRMPEVRAIRENGIPTLPQVCNGEASVILLRNEFGVPVVAGVLLDPALQLLTVGFAARGDPKQACLKAWTEAVSLQEMSRDLLDPAGAFRAAVRAGRLAGSAVKPWRADRRYMDDYRTDMRDVIDMMCQVQFYLDPRAQALASPLLATTGEVELSSIEPVDPSATSLRHLVEARGFEVFVADITTKDVAVAGYSVVRVLVPGLVPNAVAAFPFLGREAVQKAAVASGARETPLEEWELNYLPLPHA